MDKQNNIVKLIFILAFMIVGVVGMLKFDMGDDNQGRRTEHYGTTTESYMTTTESTDESWEDTSSHLIVPETMEGEWLEGEISIPRTLEVGEDGTITITEPAATWYLDNQTEEENIDMVNEMLLQEGIEVINLSVGEDKSITYTFDEENLEKYIARIEREFNKAIDELYCDVSIDEKFETLVIYIEEETDPIFEYGVDVIIMCAWMTCVQIYMGNVYDDCSINMITAYGETEEVMLEYVFDGEGEFVYDQDTWQQMFENLEKNKYDEQTSEQG